MAAGLLSYFSILPTSAFLDKTAFVHYAIQVNLHFWFLNDFIYCFVQYSTNIHVRVQLCAFKLLSTLGRVPDLDPALQLKIINKLLQAIDHDDARVRAESLRTIVSKFAFCFAIAEIRISMNFT